MTKNITEGMLKENRSAGLDFTINAVGSMFTLFFTSNRVTSFDSAKTSDTAAFGKYFQSMLKQGIYLAPSQYEAMFISNSIDQSIVDRILTAHRTAIQAI
jgi:glutamate-1-semialdehyde 2,1-aminomutase